MAESVRIIQAARLLIGESVGLIVRTHLGTDAGKFDGHVSAPESFWLKK
jgi:hypothetical protein